MQMMPVVDLTPLHDVPCVAGDLNVKVDQDRSYSPKVMGHDGFGNINGNSARLVSFAMGSDMIIGGTLFQRKKTSINTLEHPRTEPPKIKSTIPWFSGDGGRA